MGMRGLEYAPSTISNHWLNSGLQHYPSPYAHLRLDYRLYRLFLFETCYLLTDTRVPTVLN
jgi:hypothetical protein